MKHISKSTSKNRKEKEKKSEIKKSEIKKIALFPKNLLSSKDLNNAWIFLAIIVAVAIIIRIISLSDLPLNEDECYTLTSAKHLITGKGYFNEQGIIFVYIQFLFLKIFGINEAAGRLPSVLFGCGAIILIYYFCKKYFNRIIGVITSLLLASSYFEVLHSRMARPYTALQFFFILLALFFFLAFNERQKNWNTWFRLDKFGISLKYLIIFFLTFFISILIFSWVVLFWVIAMSYFFFLFVFPVDKKDKLVRKTNLILFLTFLSVIIIGMLIVKTGLLNAFLQGGSVVELFTPDLERIYIFLKETPFLGVSHYFSVIMKDFSYLWIVGFAGFLFSFKIIESKKILIFLHCIVLVQLFLLGFVIQMLYQRYLFPIYPFYLIYVALGIYGIYDLICRYVIGSNKKIVRMGIICVLFILFFLTIPFDRFNNLYKLKMFQNIYVDENFAEYTFYPHKYPCNFVNNNLKENDVVVSTIPRVDEFYINKDIFLLRQAAPNLKRPNDPDQLTDDDKKIYPNSMVNFISFIEFLKTHKSGWLIADPRIYSKITPQTRDFIFQHFNFHFCGFDPSWATMVSSWDSTTLRSSAKLFIPIGILNNPAQVPVKEILFPETNLPPNIDVKFQIIYEGVEKNNEGIFSINNKTGSILVNKNQCEPDTIETIISSNEILKSRNIIFRYNSECGDSYKGFLIQDLHIIIPR